MADTIRMKSPDGEIANVPMEDVPHYKSLGAVTVYGGAPDVGLSSPDPVGDFIAIASAAGPTLRLAKAGYAGIRALPGAVRMAGGPLGEMVASKVPVLGHLMKAGNIANAAPELAQALRGAGKQVASNLGQPAIQAVKTAEEEVSAAARRLAQHRIAKGAAKKAAQQSGKIAGEIKPKVASVEKRITASEKAAQLGRNRAPRRSLAANETTGGVQAAERDLMGPLSAMGPMQAAGVPLELQAELAARGITSPEAIAMFMQRARAAGLIH